MLFEQVTIIGVGLIGGSVGLAARSRGVTRRVVGLGRDAKNLARAVERGAVDHWTTDPSEGVSDADLVVICTPVDRIAETALRIAPHCRDGAIITDAGSTKAELIKAIQQGIRGGVEFVGSHPVAGSEKTGVDYARGDLFTNRVTVVTTESRSADAVGRVVAFWEALGSRVVQMDSAAHDRALAVTSHVPHAVASAVAGATSPDLLTLTAGGFRDVTRIAAGDPQLWAAIFQANKDGVLSALAEFTDRMNEFRTLLEAGDRAGLERWLSEGKQVRDALGT